MQAPEKQIVILRKFYLFMVLQINVLCEKWHSGGFFVNKPAARNKKWLIRGTLACYDFLSRIYVLKMLGFRYTE